MNRKNASQTPAILERNVMLIGKIFMYWVKGDIAECFFLIYVEWKMRMPEREAKQLLSALSRNFGSKLTLRLMGELLECLLLWGFHIQNSKSCIWNNHQLKANKISYISTHILSMWSKRCGIQIKLKRIFSPALPAALHSSNDVMQWRAQTFWRAGAKIRAP